MKQKFRRDISALESIFKFIETFAGKHNLDEQLVLTINLAVEELFTNAVKYNPDIPNDVIIEFLKSKDILTISIVDYTVEPFDLNKVPEYDISASLQGRPIGKLGIHFIKNMFDSVDHEYKNNLNKIILTKNLGMRDA